MAMEKHTAEPCSLPPPKRPEGISEAHQSLYDKVLGHFTGLYTLPGYDGAEDETGELSSDEQRWLTKEAMLRFLRASKWDVDHAIRRLEATLKWRRSFGLYSFITPEFVEPEGVTGKIVLYGYDNDSRPSIYMLPSRQNTDGPERQIQYTVWCIERSIELMDQGIENLVLLIDFADKAENPSMSTARAMLNILQDHYPERLGKAFIINVPYYVQLFLKLIRPFIDPKTKEKIRVNPSVIDEKLYMPTEITTKWGGDINFIFEHDKYWPALLSLCQERQAAEVVRWQELGGIVGISEWDIKSALKKAVEDQIGDFSESTHVELKINN